MAQLIKIWNELRSSYWFVPTIMAIAALLLASGMVYVDSHAGSTWMDGMPWLYAARPDGARALLSSIGGSMIGVAALAQAGRIDQENLRDRNQYDGERSHLPAALL